MRNTEAAETLLQRGQTITAWFDGLWAALLGITLYLSGTRFLQSAAWQRVLDWTPGGRFTLTMTILIFGVGSLVLIPLPRWRPIAVCVVSAWCFFVASFQVYSAFHDEAGPLGFFAWYYVSFQLLKHVFQNSWRLQ